MTDYRRGSAAAIRALVRDDAVHRDVYVSSELFDLEMERLWRSAWVYVGHDSQVPNAGDFYTVDIARQPLLMLRGTDGAVRVLLNRCAHKGAKIAGRGFRQLRQAAALLLPRLDLHARRHAAHRAGQERLCRHAVCGVGSRRGD